MKTNKKEMQKSNWRDQLKFIEKNHHYQQQVGEAMVKFVTMWNGHLVCVSVRKHRIWLLKKTAAIFSFLTTLDSINNNWRETKSATSQKTILPRNSWQNECCWSALRRKQMAFCFFRAFPGAECGHSISTGFLLHAGSECIYRQSRIIQHMTSHYRFNDNDNW